MALTALMVSCASTEHDSLSSGSIDIAVQYQVDTLDPHAWNYLGNFALASHFYEALVTSDSEMRIRPCLATRWETPDPLTWVFYLRPNVRFQSGRAFTSRDVVDTIGRLKAEPRLEMSGWVVAIREVTAIDDLTVSLRTDRPFSVLLQKLRFVHIVPGGIDTTLLADRPDGTGQYRLVRWKRGSTITMTRNKTYWGPAPAIGQVTFRLGTTSEQAARALIEGRCQIAQFDSKALSNEIGNVAHLTSLRHTSLRIEYLAFDVGSESTPHVSCPKNPFRDLRVRRALNLAIDREGLATALRTNAEPASQFVPPAVFGFNPAIRVAKYEPASAKELLREAGFADGFKVTLHSRAPFRESAAFIKEQLKLIGVDVQVEELSQDAFLERTRRRDLSMYMGRIGAITGDAGDILEIGFHTWNEGARTGFHNYGGYSNTELDRRIEASPGIVPVAARKQELESQMAVLVEDLPWLPLCVVEDIYGIDSRYAWKPRHDSFILAYEISPR